MSPPAGAEPGRSLLDRRWIPAATLVAVVVAAHASLVPRVAGVDAFYHVGHASEYASRGLFDTAFPWATQSAIGTLGADLWWGFHVTLVPFAAMGDVAGAIRAAAVVLTLVLALAVWWVLARHGVARAGWWTVLFLLMVPNVLYRFLMVRPHVLSLGLGLALVSILARGRGWQACLIAAAITWLHLGVFWLAPGIAAAYALSRVGSAFLGRADDDRPSIPVPAAVGAVLAGTVLGWLLRPHPLAAGELAWIQIVRLLEVKSSGQPLAFAGELVPLPLPELVRTSWLFLVSWACALAVAVGGAVRSVRRPEVEHPEGVAPTGAGLSGPEATLLSCCLVISVAFLGLTLGSARRALVELVAFGTLALPFAWRLAGPSLLRRRTGLILAVLLCAHVPWTGWRHLLNSRFVTFPPDLMSESADWLGANTPPGDVVFHARWDNFGPLFAHNRSNRYLGGMDPIFQFAHDPPRYWEYFYLSRDLVTEYTCDAFPCYEGNAIPTHEAIGRDFGARWVLVEPVRNPKLTEELRANPGFTLVHQTAGELIFRVEEGS